jgi:hypothetical protein
MMNKIQKSSDLDPLVCVKWILKLFAVESLNYSVRGQLGE